jgi:hypothetical protein
MSLLLPIMELSYSIVAMFRRWYCARSEDGGSNWIPISPYSDMGFYPNGNLNFAAIQTLYWILSIRCLFGIGKQ